MSGKYAKKNGKTVKKKSAAGLRIALIVILLAVLVLLVLMIRQGEFPAANSNETQGSGIESTPASQSDASETESVSEAGEAQGLSTFSLENAIVISDIGAYSGPYLEDGSDEQVTDVMSITVTNNGAEPIQYAKLVLEGSVGEAVFELTTLMPGESVMVLEANRRTYSETDAFTEARTENVACFQHEVQRYEDQLQIQPLDGGFNITNISDEDITGDIYIYYKHKSGELYLGGITYRGRIEGGMKAGEIRQIMSTHFSAEGSEVMFITIAEA